MIWVSILALQSSCLLVDEFYFHRKRGLDIWEIWSHPVDTFFYLSCCVAAAWLSPTPRKLSYFLGLCLISCLLITKDEFVHSRRCGGGETWLHSVLFILHPAALFSMWQMQNEGKKELLFFLAFAVAAFMIYQLTFWGGRWRKIRK